MRRSMANKQHGGARSGSGRPRIRRTITPDAAVALRLLAWQRYGRPTTADEEDQVLSALVMEEKERIAQPPTPAQQAQRDAEYNALLAELEAQEDEA